MIGKIAPFLFDGDGRLDADMIRLALDTHVPPEDRAWVLDRILDFAAGLRAATKMSEQG